MKECHHLNIVKVCFHILKDTSENTINKYLKSVNTPPKAIGIMALGGCFFMIDKLREHFIKPQDEYTAIPFWFWNDNLEEKEIKRQIHDFKSKGVMGFVIHPRIGIPKEIEYLSDRFMELVKLAVKEASDLGMKVVLYDEGMYPSGSAHGMVVKGNPEFASKGLKMLEYDASINGSVDLKLELGENIVSALLVEKITEKVINKASIRKVDIKDKRLSYNVKPQENWTLLVFIQSFSKGTIRGIHFGEDDGEREAPPSGDLLNPKAMDKFIALTHKRYYEYLKEYFGTTIIAMFTDEPAILGRGRMHGLRPWTDGFLDWYKFCGNKEEDLPMLWYDGGEETENIRTNYRKAVNRKLEETYYIPISKWCEEHGIALTGHPEKSDEIGFLKYFHIPGQDVVWRWVAPENNKGLVGEHSTMGKCSSDAARHMGRRRNSNECFGCCGPQGKHWAFTAADMKWYFDWLFIRGVNLVYPHAFFYSIDGPGRFGERPPDVGPNNIWWNHYNSFSDYIKRMCYLMTDSYNTTSIAVLCEEDFLPWQIVKPLYENQIEFNYLEDNLLLGRCAIEEGKIVIQKQKYGILLVENITLLTEAVINKLKDFIRGGGKVILHNPEGKEHSLEGIYEIKDFYEVLEAIDNITTRDIRIVPANKNLRVSHVIKEGVHFYAFVNEGDGPISGDLYLNISGFVEAWNPWKGTTEEASITQVTKDGVVVALKIDFRESLVLVVDENRTTIIRTIEKQAAKEEYLMYDLKSWSIKNLPKTVEELKVFDSWTNWQGMEHFSGTISYNTTFSIDSTSPKETVVLDLGEVYEVCEVYVNSNEAAVGLWAPYKFDITDYINIGENKIEIRVTNTISNKIEKTSFKSGLLGPVRIIFMNRTS